MTDISLETKVIKKFILENKQDLYINFIQKEKTRIKFINDLSHGQLFKEELFERIKGIEAEAIKKAIKMLGLNDCYIISENKKIDGKRLSINQAFNEAISPWSDIGTLIVFGDAQFLYREHEGSNNKWISKSK